ncbi:TetR family transcriptional regulator [Mesorhizobium sp. LSJC268A00]|uniref:TetR/AcrR family transcriptional regulator n=3 Tax=unclassified Mesorhizobium TaxID=325217 RepID=UPI0003CE8C50|nr:MULTISPECIES: TetR/AcrR family transcriptional regulator [unclassified Mesorhizobium]ESX27705.1 TetR family transcriptional regulator [Mesorhizobium sp. LSJC264A00]ESZ46864.1 TetR family transcriptional regulator [Mesorhizobium sp. L2C054A000]ESW82139.1 TetR family transcriptional regulator [Mesorhizobium sp. LSJC285A00]ESW93148.1 TetR family transcriptional regulator [Mesorhizobium sp. LSJC269B00]ESX06566.1 TetR family transcriptional regulator [Mesorhizobium sp. LSJC268A00]
MLDNGPLNVPNRTVERAMTIKIERPDDRGTIDRRVARTRAMLQDALIALIPECGYAALTVEDICQKADVGRSTFYTHYAGKDELRSAALEAHLLSLSRRVSADEKTGNRLFEFSLPMFEHARAFRSLHKALLASSGDTIHDQLRERIRRAVRTELSGKRIGDAGVPLEFVVQFISGAFLSVLAWWIAEDSSLSPAQVDDLFQRMAGSALPGRSP